MNFRTIGVIHTPFKNKTGMPIQPLGANGIKGRIEVFNEYRNGLKDLDGFSKIILIFNFHKSNGYKLQVRPFMDETERGVFSTRAPKRPNPIGLSIVNLEKIEKNIIYASNLDMLDNTPLIDIKPYVPEFDSYNNLNTGWLEKTQKNASKHKSDNRFTNN